MKLTEKNFYVSSSIEEIDILTDIKFAFEQFIKTQEEYLTTNLLFYADGTNAIFHIGFIIGEEDSAYLGEPISIVFSTYQQDIKLMQEFEGAIDAALKKLIFPIKNDFSTSLNFYCGNDAESEIVEIDDEMLESEAPNNLYKTLRSIEKYPSVFIRKNKLKDLEMFIRGYNYCANIQRIESEKIFPPFDYFPIWLRMIYTKSKSLDWYKTILNANENDEELALKDFFKKIKEFQEIKPILIQKAILSERNIAYQVSENNPNWEEDYSLYENPTEIYLVEYSQNFGYAYFVIDNGGNHDWLGVYKTKNEVLEILERQFGEIENWETLQGDLMKTMEYLMKIR